MRPTDMVNYVSSAKLNLVCQDFVKCYKLDKKSKFDKKLKCDNEIEM